MVNSILNSLHYSILPFIVILVVLVVVHEFGHYITAKLAGVKVLEAGLGYPPKLWSHRFGKQPAAVTGTAGAAPVDDDRTEYSLNLLPLGGFVRLLGEEDPGDPRSLAAKPRGIRIAVLAAGAFMNLLLPVVLFGVYYMIPQQLPVGRVVIEHVSTASPAQHAGVMAGDQILKINSDKVQNVGDVAYDIRLHQGQTMTWQLKRGRDLLTVQVYGRWNPPYEIDPQTHQKVREGPTGIELTSPDNFTQNQSYPIWQAFPKGVQSTWDSLVLFRNQLISFVLSKTSPPVAGPVGIAQATGEVAKAAGWSALLQFAALLSINLAVVNILPLPMLDGGRILFVLIEIARGGRRVAPEKEALVHFIGLVVLLTAVVAFTYFDIARIIHGGSLFH